MSNVHTLHRAPGPQYLKRVASAEAAMNVLRITMHGWHPADLAVEVGVSVSTIWAIRSGRTKWPRPATFFNLLRALDLEMSLIVRGVV